MTIHATEMQIEREISEEQVMTTLHFPDAIRAGRDNTTLYYRRIRVSDGRRLPAGRYLRVVMNLHANPPRVVSIYPVDKIR